MKFITEDNEKCNQYHSKKKALLNFNCMSEKYRSTHKIIKNIVYRLTEDDKFFCYSIVKK